MAGQALHMRRCDDSCNRHLKEAESVGVKRFQRSFAYTSTTSFSMSRYEPRNIGPPTARRVGIPCRDASLSIRTTRWSRSQD
jgi:hypothetical protein